LLVSLEAADGHVGHGEAAPLESFDGVGVGEVRAALEDCRQPLSQSDGADTEREQVRDACRRVAMLPQAVAAIDLALWDLAGRRARAPIWQLLRPSSSTPEVEVNATIASADRAGAAREAAAARAAGFGTVKVKVGIGDDAGRVAAVRAAAGPAMAIRLDANGAWTVAEARATLDALAPAGIELCEEPVRGARELAECSEVTEVPLAIDETAAEPGALDRRLCAAACLKISRCGGISDTLDAATRARRAGYQVYLASTLDGPLGIAAALHAAAAIGPDRPSGLATLGRFEGRLDPFPSRAGRMRPPIGCGLGDGLLGWYGVNEVSPG
jgi:L-alanine-DL-glutamate epimerase-like enolase superfamily enzyme